jgi:hypothetical protein
MILSVFPNGVSMASNATVPMTKRLITINFLMGSPNYSDLNPGVKVK